MRQIVHDRMARARYRWYMATPTSVIVLDSSVVMAGIAHVLGEQHGLCVQAIHRIDDLARGPAQGQHAVLILDIAAISADQVLAIAYQHPGISVLGIDVSGGQAIAFSSRSHPLRTTLDLTRLIQQTEDFVCTRSIATETSPHDFQTVPVGHINADIADSPG